MTQQIVKLNIGGTKYEISVSSIMQYPDSLLGVKIQKPWQQKMIKNGEEIFIDRDGKLFEYIMRYLRDGDSLVLSEDDLANSRELQSEATFFKLDGLAVIIAEKHRLLMRGGWEIGDNVMKHDLVAYDRLGVDLYFLLGSLPDSNPIGTIAEIRPNGKPVVRFECWKSAATGLPALYGGGLHPKNA